MGKAKIPYGTDGRWVMMTSGLTTDSIGKTGGCVLCDVSVSYSNNHNYCAG